MVKKEPKYIDPANVSETDRAAARGEAPDPSADETAADRAEADAAADEAPAAVTPQTDLLEPLRAELEEAKDRALRSQAELENYRKRVAREMQEERRYANLPLMRDLVPVLDNMQRAIEAAENTHDAAGLLEGVKMVAQQFEDVLRRHHCVRLEALHQPFDPNRHEAISQQPSDEHPAGTVLQVTQTGFQLHDRVVRPSQVVVSTDNRPDEREEQQEEKES